MCENESGSERKVSERTREIFSASGHIAPEEHAWQTNGNATKSNDSSAEAQ